MLRSGQRLGRKHLPSVCVGPLYRPNGISPEKMYADQPILSTRPLRFITVIEVGDGERNGMLIEKMRSVLAYLNWGNQPIRGRVGRGAQQS